MHQIDKFIKKLEPKYKTKILEVLQLIKKRNFLNLDLKVLKGHKKIYRVRIGIYRIIFEDTGTHIYIIKIDKRNDTIYSL